MSSVSDKLYDYAGEYDSDMAYSIKEMVEDSITHKKILDLNELEAYEYMDKIYNDFSKGELIDYYGISKGEIMNEINEHVTQDFYNYIKFNDYIGYNPMDMVKEDIDYLREFANETGVHISDSNWEEFIELWEGSLIDRI